MAASHLVARLDLPEVGNRHLDRLEHASRELVTILAAEDLHIDHLAVFAML